MAQHDHRSGASRRALLTGIGAAGLATAAGVALPPGVAHADDAGDPAGTGTPGPVPEGRAEARALIAGLAYRTIDAFAFFPSTVGAARTRSTGNSGVTSAPIGRMEAALDLPVGATLREITVYCTGAAAGTVVGLLRKEFPAGFYTFVAPGQVAVPASGGVTSAVLDVDQPVTENTVYAIAVDLTAGSVAGVRIGYLAPAQAFVPLSPVPRVLDTRNGGGKLLPAEERIVELGVPGFAKGAVINLTVTETEVAGYVAVFPADVAWPGNSSINWSEDDQNLANGVITAVDPAGRVRIRGGEQPTHVVIDVQGYLL